MISAYRRHHWALATVCVVLFLTFLDNTVVSVALANIRADIPSGVTDLEWVVNGYALTFAAFMLAGGTLGDLYGRKKVMMGGIAIFCAGSVVCAVADDSPILIIGRAVMGVGAAASEPGTLSMIRHVYPDRRRRARALGCLGGCLRTGAGPRTGDRRRPRRALGLPRHLLVQPDLRRAGLHRGRSRASGELRPAGPSPRHPRPGARGGRPGRRRRAPSSPGRPRATTPGGYSPCSRWAAWPQWGSSSPNGTCATRSSRRGSGGTGRSPARTSWSSAPTSRSFRSSSSSRSTCRKSLGKSAYQLATTFLPMAVALIVASTLTGRWVARRGARVPMTVGSAVAALGVGLTDVILDQHVNLVTLAVILVIAGAGFGIVLVPVTTAVLSTVPAERSGMAASVTNTSRELGAVFGVAVLGALTNAQLNSSLTSQLKALGIPADFQAIIFEAITQGASPESRRSRGARQPRLGPPHRRGHQRGVHGVRRRVACSAAHLDVAAGGGHGRGRHAGASPPAGAQHRLAARRPRSRVRGAGARPGVSAHLADGALVVRFGLCGPRNGRWRQ